MGKEFLHNTGGLIKFNSWEKSRRWFQCNKKSLMKYLTKFLIAPTIEKNHSFRINLQVGGIREECG